MTDDVAIWYAKEENSFYLSYSNQREKKRTVLIIYQDPGSNTITSEIIINPGRFIYNTDVQYANFNPDLYNKFTECYNEAKKNLENENRELFQKFDEYFNKQALSYRNINEMGGRRKHKHRKTRKTQSRKSRGGKSLRGGKKYKSRKSRRRRHH
jgi:hypothetical protein